MRQFTHTLSVPTRGQGLFEITAEVKNWVERCGIGTGLLTVYIRHTSASLLIQENADPDVVRDLRDFFARIAPEDAALYRHTVEGPDDMPAHIRAALTATQVSIPIVEGAPALGTWQGVYVFEHRSRPQRRNVMLHAVGE